eukprot:12650114-Alexandrium_andersonii.AAC.1
MSASLVGSEMCIRDSPPPPPRPNRRRGCQAEQANPQRRQDVTRCLVCHGAQHKNCFLRRPSSSSSSPRCANLPALRTPRASLHCGTPCAH